MDSWNHRNRVLVCIDASENASRVDDTGKSLVDDLGREMLQVQVDVILLFADPPPLADLNRFGSADHVARGEVFLARRIFRHKPLALTVGEIATLAAGALRDQTAGAIDAGWVELNELHVLQRQPGTQYHGVAVAGARVS